HAFHIGSGLWVTTLHAIENVQRVTIGPTLNAEPNVACTISGVDASHDLALIQCAETATTPAFPLAAPADVWSEPTLEMAYLSTTVPGVLLRRPVYAPAFGTKLPECEIAEDGLLLPRPPSPGESG